MIPFLPLIPAPHIRNAEDDLPRVLTRVELSELCTIAGVPCCVSGGEDRSIACVVGSEHFSVGRDYFVGVGSEWRATPNAALRVLEVLAHGFHDYAARECVCGKGLFSVPKRQGRPPNGVRAQTARERMAAMRARRASA
jgi:hypothetical protein